MNRFLLLTLIAGVAMASHGAVPDLDDTFDVLYANGFAIPATSATNGWQASDGTVMVTNGGAFSAPNAAILSGTATLTNTQDGAAGLRVWTDYQVNAALGVEPLNLPTNTASFLCYFDTNGWLVIATAAGCQVYTNDTWGNTVPPVTNGYARLSIFQDYSTFRQAVLLNAHLVVQDLPFVGNAANYNQLVFQNTDSNSLVDNVWIKTNIGPTDLVGDLNGDGTNDAVEIQLYGYASRTQYVGGTGYPNYSSIQAALDAWRTRDTLWIAAGSSSGDVSVTNSMTFCGDGPITNSGTLTVSGASSVVFQNAMSWGPAVTVNTNSQATFNGALSCSNLTVRAGSTVIVSSLVCSNLVVEPGASFTCTGSFECTGTCTFNSGAIGVFAGSVLCGGAFTVESGASVSLGQGGVLGSLAADGTVVIGVGQTLVVGTATVSGGVQLTGSGTLDVSGSLSVTGSGTLAFTNSRLLVPLDQVDITGTFTINNTWGSVATMSLPFTDNFESYANNTPLPALGFRGWAASSSAAMVQNAVKHGGTNALQVPVGTVVSNRIDSGSATRIWTDYTVQPVIGLLPDTFPTNGVSFLGYVNSNGFLVVEVAGGEWVVCSNKYDNTPVTPISTGSFTRITVCQELVHHTFAVFVAGELVAEGLVQPEALTRYSSFVADNTDDSSYLDDVSITTTVPSGMPSDLNRNGISDAYEIGANETATFPPAGSVFKIR